MRDKLGPRCAKQCAWLFWNEPEKWCEPCRVLVKPVWGGYAYGDPRKEKHRSRPEGKGQP